MTVKVLVVDDSGFFRRRVTEILQADPQIEVIGTASNGREAVEKVLALSPDVVTMDYEMPVMDGITAVRRIMEAKPTPVLMFSSLTHEGARVTLDALEAGAVDFLPKNFEDISRNATELSKVLSERIRTVARSRSHHRAPPSERAIERASLRSARAAESKRTVEPAPRSRPRPAPKSAPEPVARTYTRGASQTKLVAIGTSTGGPVALQTVLTELPENFPCPIVMIQHMPATFTHAFADRLNRLCKIAVKEAEDGDKLQAGTAYLAPGGKQMMVDARGSIHILPGDDRLNYKPCVDVTFGSAAKAYGSKVLAVVLTGMGADGREGARMLKEAGSRVWSQDQASCVIYGMPMAIEKAGLADKVLPLIDVSKHMVEEV